MTYTNGERKTFANIEYSSFADYYEKLLNQFAAIEMNVREEIAVQTEECEKEAKAKAEEEAKSEEEVRIRRLVEEAEEEMERLQEERRREMAERRRQDESMDKFERFFNNLSGQGSWTNEELARMGKKTSDEMWTDEQLREMYRNKF